MILPEKTITIITEYIQNQLQAHEADIAEEMAASEDGQASIVFAVKVRRLTPEKCSAKIVTRIPRGALVVETVIDDWQARLPGMM